MPKDTLRAVLLAVLLLLSGAACATGSGRALSERVAASLAKQRFRGDAAQLVVDLRQRLLRGLAISPAPPLEKLGERWFSHDHDPVSRAGAPRTSLFKGTATILHGTCSPRVRAAGASRQPRVQHAIDASHPRGPGDRPL